MLEPIYPKTFRKQYKLMKKRGMAVNKLLEIMKKIINEQPLPPERRNHQLHGNYEGMLECHIQGDWVLVYEIDPATHTVAFHRTGSHSDLF
jgi:mRNA interferase YafQ